MSKNKKFPAKPSHETPDNQAISQNIGQAEAAPAASFFEQKWLPVAVLLAASALAYANALTNGFMIFDDDRAIRYNQIIKHPTLAGIFGSNNLGMYAPVTWLGYSLVYALAGEQAWAFHAFSLLLHLGCVWLVFEVLKSLEISAEVAFFTALLFGVHPMQAEAVCWIAGQSALTFSLFYLLALWLYVRGETQGNRTFYWLCLLAFLASALAKSAAVTLPLLLLAFDWHRSGQITWKNIVGKIPFFAISLALGLLTFATREAEGHNLVVNSKTYNLFDRLLMVSHSLLFYPFKLLIPSNLSIFYPMEKVDGRWSLDYYLAPLVVLALGWLVWKFAQKSWANRPIGLAAAWYVLPLAVMLPYVSVGTFEMRSDRYVYISSAGFLLLVVLFLQKLQPRLRRGLLVGAAAGLAVLAYFQSKHWKNEVAAFENCVEHYPEAPLCNCNLAYGELLNRDFEKCVEHYTKTLALDPGYVEAFNGRGQAYFELKKFPEAFGDFDKAIQAGIVTPKLFLNRGKCHVILSRPAEAIPDLQRSAELEPKNPETWYFLAVAQNKTGDATASLSSYSKAIDLRPDYLEARVNRGLIFFNNGQTDEAISDYTAALSANPNVPLALFNRANAYLKNGKIDLGLADVNRAVQMQPNNPKLYETRVQLLRAAGRMAEAAKDLEKIQAITAAASH